MQFGNLEQKENKDLEGVEVTSGFSNENSKIETEEVIEAKKILEKEGVNISDIEDISKKPAYVKKAYLTLVLALGLFSLDAVEAQSHRNELDSKNNSGILKEKQESPFTQDYKSDSTYYRAVDSGMSVDINVAKKIALMNADKKIMNQMSQGKEDKNNVHQATLNNITIIDEKVFKSVDGSYTYWIAIEMEK